MTLEPPSTAHPNVHPAPAPGGARRRPPGGRGGIPALRVSAALAVLTLALSACSSGATATSSAAAGPADAVVGVTAGAPAAPDAPKFDSGTREASPASAPGAGPVVDPGADAKIIKNAALALTVEQIGPAAAKIRAAVAGLGGHVTDETVNVTDTPPAGPLPNTTRGGDTPYAVPRIGNYGQLTFAVPADKLEAAMDAVAAQGTVVQRTSSSTDVTATYVDTETRIATKKASIDRIRALMTQTQNISQVVELEGQLASREAELESLQAQLRALKDRVAMSTLTVVISTSVAGTNPPTPETGFVAGLKSAWNAFLSSIAALLTALGAALPWALVLALVAVPLWRRRRGTGSSGMPRPVPPAPPTPREPAGHPAPRPAPEPVSAAGATPESAAPAQTTGTP